MGHLAGADIVRKVNSIEVVSDDSQRVLRFRVSEAGHIDIQIRDSTTSEWSYEQFATLQSTDAEMVAKVLSGGDLRYGPSVLTRLEAVKGAFTLPKAEPEKGPLDGDCTPLDIERAKAENLKEERQNIELSMERDHALDRHVGALVVGCPACDRRIYPGHYDGSRSQDDEPTTDPEAEVVADDTPDPLRDDTPF